MMDRTGQDRTGKEGKNTGQWEGGRKGGMDGKREKREKERRGQMKQENQQSSISFLWFFSHIVLSQTEKMLLLVDKVSRGNRLRGRV